MQGDVDRVAWLKFGALLVTIAMAAAAVAALRADVGGEKGAYEAECCVQFLYKALLLAQPALPPRLDCLRSLAAQRPPSSGTRAVDGASDASKFPACAPRVKLAARRQATGEATYATDEPRAWNEVSLAYAYAKTGGGVLTSVDAAAAKRTEGCVAVYVKADLEAMLATLALDDDDDKLLYGPGDAAFVGCRVALCVGDSDVAALAAARVVSTSVRKEAARPATLDARALEGALEAHFSATGTGKGRRLGLKKGAIAVEGNAVALVPSGGAKSLAKKTATTAKKAATTAVVSGAFKAPLQKHFHLETHSARCVATEGRLLLTASTQDPTLTQSVVAKLLAVRAADVVVTARRAGGGFGGKLTLHLPAAAAAAAVARHLGRPARYHADRRADMAMTGGREATDVRYAVGFDPATGAMAHYDVTFHLEAGCAATDAVGDLSMAVQWSDNCYRSGVHSAKGTVEKTRAPRSSSMRSPGVLQSQCCRELALVRVAHAAQLPVLAVQEANLYAKGDSFPYAARALGAEGFNYTIPDLWAAMRPRYCAAKEACDAFNATNAWRKRGVHLMPTKYIMAMDFWKIAALVQVFADGSVQVAHGGSELGQGIHTKVAAAAAYALGCPLDEVMVADTCTDKTANSVATGGSGTSESSCGAAMQACQVLKERLAPYVAKKPGDWAGAVADAANDAVHLSATGWNDLRTSPDGDDPDYATYGVALAEVEVDCLSGEVEVREVAIKMDMGTSLNSDVDVGQIEGALVMALGYYLTEHCAVDAQTGRQTGDGTWDYKPPLASDVPLLLDVSMLDKTPNPSVAAVLGSKASGEPPMQLAASVFFAVRDAIAAFRETNGDADWFDLDIPASPKAVRAALGDLDDAALTLT